MATLTIRLTDEKHARLRQLAERRKISVNKLIDELSTAALAEFDAEVRFRARAPWARPRKPCASWKISTGGTRNSLASAQSVHATVLPGTGRRLHYRLDSDQDDSGHPILQDGRIVGHA